MNAPAPRRQAPGRAQLAAAALAGLTTAVSFQIAANLLETLPHIEDEFAYLWQAHVMAEGRLTLPSPPEPESFLVPFVVDHDGQRFGKYPPGWPALLAVGVAAGAAPWVNPLLAGAAVWLSFCLGRRLAGDGAGVLTALLTATSPMLLMLSGTLMSHMLSLVLTLGWMLAWFDLFCGPQVAAPGPPRAIRRTAAGLALGLLALTRPLTAVAVALPFALHALWMMARRREVARDLSIIAGVALAVVLILPVWQWALTGDPTTNPYTLYWPYDRLGFGPGIGPLPEGHSLRQAWVNTRLSLGAWQHDLFGWPWLSWIFVLPGLWALRRKAEGWLAVAIFPSLAIVYLAYWVGSWLLGPRYYVEALPSLAALSAAGMVAVGGWAKDRVAGGRVRRLSVAGAVGLLMMVNLAGYLPTRLNGLRGLFGINRAALEAFEAVDPGAAVVIVRRNPYWHGYGNLLTLTPPFRANDLILLYERGAEIDERLAATFDDLPVYRYDPEQPELLEQGLRGLQAPPTSLTK